MNLPPLKSLYRIFTRNMSSVCSWRKKKNETLQLLTVAVVVNRKCWRWVLNVCAFYICNENRSSWTYAWNAFDTIPLLQMQATLHSVRIHSNSCAPFFGCGWFLMVFRRRPNFYGILLINLLIALNPVLCRLLFRTPHLWHMYVRQMLSNAFDWMC